MWHTPRFPGRILFSPSDRSRNGSRRSSHRRRSAVFRLERLEDRTVLSTLTVLNSLDSGPGSLRDTIAAASHGDTINFAKKVHNITLTSGELDITQNLDIEGPGPNKLKISGNDASRVFDISAGETVTIAGLTITDGLATGTPAHPQHRRRDLESGDLTLINDVLSDNQAVGATNDRFSSTNGFTGVGVGGGVINLGTLNVTGCQFINNQARALRQHRGHLRRQVAAVGGAIAESLVRALAPAAMADSQFAGNVARGGNGGDSGDWSAALRWSGQWRRSSSNGSRRHYRH